MIKNIFRINNFSITKTTHRSKDIIFLNTYNFHLTQLKEYLQDMEYERKQEKAERGRKLLLKLNLRMLLAYSSVYLDNCQLRRLYRIHFRKLGLNVEWSL